MVKKIIILIASLLGVISTFLPWATVSVSVLGQSASESVNGTEGDGWITLMLFVAIIVITVVSSLKDYKKELPMWAKIATTAVAVICSNRDYRLWRCSKLGFWCELGSEFVRSNCGHKHWHRFDFDYYHGDFECGSCMVAIREMD